jgi:hypothetical protein
MPRREEAGDAVPRAEEAGDEDRDDMERSWPSGRAAGRAAIEAAQTPHTQSQDCSCSVQAQPLVPTPVGTFFNEFWLCNENQSLTLVTANLDRVQFWGRRLPPSMNGFSSH